MLIRAEQYCFGWSSHFVELPLLPKLFKRCELSLPSDRKCWAYIGTVHSLVRVSDRSSSGTEKSGADTSYGFSCFGGCAAHRLDYLQVLQVTLPSTNSLFVLPSL